MSKQEFLNFGEISKIKFEEVLNWLNVPFQTKNGELRGDGFIINISKNLFFCPDNDNLKGSVINFTAHYKQIELRQAASLLKQQFLSKKETKPKRDIPNLTLEWHPYLEERGITPEIAKEYEVGFVGGQRSVIANRIAFKCYNHQGVHIGYIGYKEQDGSWYFPRGFKRPLYGSYKLKDKKSVIVTTDPFDALKIALCGFSQVVSLLSDSMTAEQEVELKKYRYILLFHQKPNNIINRLFNTSFIKAPVLSKAVLEISQQELIQIIKPSK